MTKAKNNQQEGQQALENALLKALENETFIEGLSKKVARQLEGELMARTSKKPDIVWKRTLEEAGLTLAEDTSTERIAELYPMTAEEIESVVNNIKTSKISKPLTLDIIGNNVVLYLGDKELRNRISEFIGDHVDCYPFREHRELECETIANILCEPSIVYACGNDFKKMVIEKATSKPIPKMYEKPQYSIQAEDLTDKPTVKPNFDLKLQDCDRKFWEVVKAKATSNPKYKDLIQKTIQEPLIEKPELYREYSAPPTPQSIKAIKDFIDNCDNAFWKTMVKEVLAPIVLA